MERPLRFAAALAAVCCCALLLSGCSTTMRLPKEMEVAELEVIAALGIDKGFENGAHIAVTAAGANPTTDKDGRDPLIITTEQSGLSKALAELEGITRKHVYLGHMGYYIAGEDLMRGGMTGFIDYLTRDSSTRMSTKLFVARGCSARELIVKTADKENYITDMLRSYERESGDSDVIEVTKLSEVVQDMLESGAALVPAVSLIKNGIEHGIQKPGGNPAGSEPEKGKGPKEAEGAEPPEQGKEGGEASKEEGAGVTLDFTGYGVLKGGKLEGFIDRDDARFVKIIKKGLFALIIDTKTDEGIVSLRASSGNVTVTPVFSDAGNLKKLRLDIEMSSSLAETDGGAFQMTDESLEKLRMAQSDEIEKGCKKLIALSQEMGADFLGLGRRARLAAPLEFKHMKTPFEEVFPSLEIEVGVTSQIVRTQSARQNVGTEVRR